MTEHTRRGVLRTAAVAGVGAPFTLTKPAEATSTTSDSRLITVGRNDPRYVNLTRRGYNKRFAGSPDYVHVASSTEQVAQAVRDAAQSGKRLVVRGGGHCMENFVDDPSVDVVVDLSEMRSVSFDQERNAFVVQAGAILGEMYRELYLRWGVTIPAGEYPDVGLGGHVPGGGYGPLSRLHGLCVDHLYAVEVVTVTRSGEVTTVIATREPHDPNRELWWAHTGGGGGNFGVVTRYWFRTPQARSADPSHLLPQPPARILSFSLTWPWQGMNEESFSRLLRNHGHWHAGTDDDPRLYSEFFLQRPARGGHLLLGQIAGAGSEADRLLEHYTATLSQGVHPAPVVQRETMPWLSTATAGLAGQHGERWRTKEKSGYLRKPLTDRQIAIAYQYLTTTTPDVTGGGLTLASYGGHVNTISPTATATAQRDSILKAFLLAAWDDSGHDEAHLTWMRQFYRDLYADTGGVPVPNGTNDGCYINYPDIDVADPHWNTSGVPWHTLYYKDSYTRLQQVKARWDPRNIFRHALSVR